MNITLEEQIRGLFLSIGAGMLMGLIYDFFRILRIFWKPPARQLFVLDFLSVIVCGLWTFLLLLAAEKGHIRIYLLLGETMGFLVWRFTAGKVTVWLAEFFFSFTQRYIFTPLKKIQKRIFCSFDNIWKSISFSRKERGKDTKKP